MKRAVIIGGGFAGLSAARMLGRANGFHTTLINRHPETHFRPLLPDVAAGALPPRLILAPIEGLGRRSGFSFVRGEVSRVDFDDNRLGLSDGGEIPYDYLIVAAGSETNFHGNDEIRSHAHTLDNAVAATTAARALGSGGYRTVVVCGGGYTGIEIATHVRRAMHGRGRAVDILIVEALDTILGGLQDWMRDYTWDNLRRLGIDVRTGTTVESVDERRVSLSDGATFEDACLIWTAGMKMPALLRDWDVPRGSQGRIRVQSDLRFKPNVFAVGDAACFEHGDSCFRMAVQAAHDQGRHAARSILRLARGRAPLPFRLRDPGFIVPMANWRSCGNALGRRVEGVAATGLHYLLSSYRSFGPGNTAGVLGYAVRSFRMGRKS